MGSADCNAANATGEWSLSSQKKLFSFHKEEGAVIIFYYLRIFWWMRHLGPSSSREVKKRKKRTRGKRERERRGKEKEEGKGKGKERRRKRTKKSDRHCPEPHKSVSSPPHTSTPLVHTQFYLLINFQGLLFHHQPWLSYTLF